MIGFKTEKKSTGYYIMDGGYYWRPESKGHTNNIHEAGTYTLEQAKEILSKIDIKKGVTILKLSSQKIVPIKKRKSKH